MDSLHWANLNKNIKFTHTKKMYFGRYLWRLEYNIPCAYLVTDYNAKDIQQYIERQIQFEHYAKRQYYPTRKLRDWSTVDSVLLERIRQIRLDNKDRVRFRMESDSLQLFTETEEDLKYFSEQIGCYNLVSLTYPKAGTESALLSGTVFMGEKTEHKYKIVLRDGDYSMDIKRQVLTQLNADPDIKVPNQLYTMLNRRHGYIWNCYCYTNDTGITTILSLIAPGIVGKIHEISHLQ